MFLWLIDGAMALRCTRYINFLLIHGMYLISSLGGGGGGRCERVGRISRENKSFPERNGS